jgi:hypothetical protein
MPGINDEAFGRIDGVATKSHAQLAEDLGTLKTTISSVKAGRRGMSPELAKSVAMKSGEKAATLFITSAATALKQKMKAETIGLNGVVDAAQMALKSVSTKFTPDQIDRREPEFRQAILELRTAAHKALELLGDTEYVLPTHATGDSVEVALKSRDLQGRAVEEGPAILRDAYGRRVNNAE